MFIVLVSLITIVLSIPITLALSYLLENYASVWPTAGDSGTEDVAKLHNEGDIGAERDKDTDSKSSKIPFAVAALSPLGKLINFSSRGPETGGAVEARTGTGTGQEMLDYAHTGTSFCAAELLCYTSLSPHTVYLVCLCLSADHRTHHFLHN